MQDFGRHCRGAICRGGNVYDEYCATKVPLLPLQLLPCQMFEFRWNADVVERIQWEFRGFVSNCKLTAITQYFSICYFEELSRNQDEICTKLVEYHDRIKTRIQPHLTSYGIDFFIASDGTVITIELNPFYTRSTPALYYVCSLFFPYSTTVVFF